MHVNYNMCNTRCPFAHVSPQVTGLRVNERSEVEVKHAYLDLTNACTCIVVLHVCLFYRKGLRDFWLEYRTVRIHYYFRVTATGWSLV